MDCSDRQRLCLDPDRRSDADRDREEEAARQLVRDRHQRQFQISKVFLHDPERANSEAGLHAWLLQGGRSATTQTADDRLSLC